MLLPHDTCSYLWVGNNWNQRLSFLYCKHRVLAQDDQQLVPGDDADMSVTSELLVVPDVWRGNEDPVEGIKVLFVYFIYFNR